MSQTIQRGKWTLRRPPRMPAWFEAAKFRCLRLAPYIAMMVCRMQAIEVKGLGTFATDSRGRLYYDDAYGASLPVEEAAALMAHEAWHVLMKHTTRYQAYMTPMRTAELIALGWEPGDLPFQANVAMDMEINDGLAVDFERGGKRPLQGRLFPSQIGMPDGDRWEAYAAKIFETPPPPREKYPDTGGIPGGDADDGEGDGGSGSGDDRHGSATGGPQREWELDQTGAEAIGDEKLPGLSEGQKETLRQLVAQEIMRRGKAAGKNSAGLKLWAEEQLKRPEVPWQQLLRSCLRNGIATARGRMEQDWSKPNKKALALRRIVPRAPLLPGTTDIEPVLALVVDTSGSMGSLVKGEPLWHAVSETLAVCREQEAAPWVTCVETEASEVKQVKRPEDLAKLLKGGGGTDMAAGVRGVFDAGLKPDLIAIVTDGYTPWPEEHDLPRTTQLAVVITPGGAEDLSGLPDRALVFRMKEERDGRS